MYSEPSTSPNRGFDPIIPLLALAFDDNAFAEVQSMDDLQKTPKLLDGIRQHGNKLPLLFKADILDTLILRDTEFIPGQGWKTCEVKGLGYAWSLNMLKTIARAGGIIGALPSRVSPSLARR